jgi:hypothetical protein
MRWVGQHKHSRLAAGKSPCLVQIGRGLVVISPKGAEILLLVDYHRYLLILILETHIVIVSVIY